MREQDQPRLPDRSASAAHSGALRPDPRRSLPSPRLILFDLDDTLCDYAGARAARLRIAFGQALETTRRPPAPTIGEQTNPLAGDPAPDLDTLIAASIAIHPHGADHFPDLLRPYGVAAEAAELASAWYRTNRFHGLRLFADAVATIEALRRSEAGAPRRIGLITNGPAEVQRAKIDLLGIGPLLDLVLISGEFGVEKPDPAIFREALRRGDAAPEEAIFVGDSPDHDVAGARAAGIRAVWLNRGGHPWSHAGPAPAPADEIRDLAAFVALLTAAPGNADG